MKRNYPYNGPGTQAQGAPSSAYGQPPPPAGPAPPLPASGQSSAAYANYGYGSVAPSRHTAAPMIGAAASDAQQHQWNQHWSQPQQQPQQQQPYYPQQQPNAVSAPGAAHFAAPRPPSQSGPYRGVAAPNASSLPVNQNAAYSPHQPQQSVPYSYQPQAPLQQQPQPAAPHNYGYAPSMPPHQSVAPSPANNSAQNWPGAYAPGSQGGPPSKKPRYQASPNPIPPSAAPYGATGAAPMAPVSMNAPGNAMGQYSPQQPYGWQGPHAAPAPHLNPQPIPGHPAPHGRVPSGSGIHANAPGNGGSFASPARIDKGGKGMGGAGAASGRGMSRNGAQNRANMPQGLSNQRAGLPPNPTASVNTARAPHGQTRAWGSKASTGSGVGAGNKFQAGRRVSSASSVHSDKNAAGGSKKLNTTSQGMVPPDAPRGPNNARNKAASGSSNASMASSQTMKNGNAAAVQGARGSRVGGKNAAVGGSSSGGVAGMDMISSTSALKDMAASSKRAHTDFRILGLEIKQLDWSWFAPQALAQDADGVRDDTIVPSDASEVAKQDESETDGATAAAASESVPVDDPPADAESAETKTSTQEEAQGHDDDQEKGTDDQPNTAEDEHANEENHEDDEVNLEYDEEASNAEDDADHDDNVDADGDGDQDDDGDLDADAEEDVAMSHADTDTVASEQQHSVAPTPEPNGESSKVAKAATQQGKASKAERTKTLANMRDSTKLRLCFAAMSNAGPEGAPTGPKSAKTQKDPEIKVENSDQDESSANQSKEAAKEPSAGENNAKGEESAEEASKETVPETKESSESEVPVSFDDVQNEVASAGVTAQPAEVGVIAPDAEIEVKEEDPVKVEEQPKEEEDAKAADDDAALSSAPSKGKKPDSEPQAKGPPQLSLNRIFLSFAANRKRLAIDAEAVKSVKIHRSEHWIEIRIDASRQVDQTARKKGEGYLVCRGTLLEKRAKGQVNYTAVTRSDIAAAWDRAQNDVKPSDAELTDNEHLELPPFFRLDESSTDLVLQVHLDPSAPLPEPAWLRKNDVNELFASLQRGSSAIAGQSDTAVSVGTAQHVWAGKIEVLDPDPPPSMSTFLYEWVKESFIGSQKERRTFVDELLGRKKKDKAEEPASARVEGEEEAVVDEKPIKVEQGEEESDAERDSRVARAFVEIVLRLIKGERVSLPPTTTTDGIFAQALTTTSYTSSMTYPGLFMLSLLDLSLHNDAADAAKVRAQVDKMLMEMPRATLVKAVDLTWKDVEVGRKGSNGTSGAAANSAPVMKGGGQRRYHQQQHGRHHQHQHQHQHHRAGGGGVGQMNQGARHGKRKRG